MRPAWGPLTALEQGPILEQTKRNIGVVSGGQAYKWFRISIDGRDSHAGTTPLAGRADALLFAAQCISRSNEIASKFGGLATTGILSLQPGSINTIPKRVEFTLDIRHHSDSSLADMESALRDVFKTMASESGSLASASTRGCLLGWEEIFHSPAVPFDQRCISKIREAAEDLVGGDKVMDIISGAGHDSCSTASRVPTGMIFVPSKDGLSHNPTEYTSDEDW